MTLMTFKAALLWWSKNKLNLKQKAVTLSVCHSCCMNLKNKAKVSNQTQYSSTQSHRKVVIFLKLRFCRSQQFFGNFSVCFMLFHIDEIYLFFVFWIIKNVLIHKISAGFQGDLIYDNIVSGPMFWEEILLKKIP